MGATASVLTGKTGKNRPNVVSKITFANAKALTAEQEKFIREAYATAAGAPIEDVALAQDPDRALTYIVTVYVKDEDQARKVMTKGLKVQAGCCGLRDIAGVKSALKNTGYQASIVDTATITAPVGVAAKSALSQVVEVVGKGVSDAYVAAKPSAQTKKLVKTYAKEGYRQAAYYTKRGVRSAARGLTIAAAVYSKFDVAGSKRRKQDIEEREIQRRKLLMAKKALGADDDGMVEIASKGLIIIEGDASESGSDNERVEEDAFADIFGAGADQHDAETFYKESSADKLRKQKDPTPISTKKMSHSQTIQIVRTRNNTRKMRIKIAQTVCEPRYLPEKAAGGGLVNKVGTPAEEAKKTVVNQVGMNVMVAVKLKKMINKRRKERQANEFQASSEALQKVNLEAIDGTDVQGWNRAPHHAVYWSQFNIYIIRAFGDCQKEVNVLYTDVLPKIRQVMLGCAINVQLRDLGSISRPLPKDRPPEYKAPIGISLSSIQERNSVCLILVGFDYGGSWKTTSGTVSLKDLGLEDPDEADFPEELSELEILAMRAAQMCEVKHTVFTSKKSAPRTFMYTCVDPDSPFRYQGGLSPMAIRESGDSQPKADQTKDTFKKVEAKTAQHTEQTAPGSRSPVGGKSPGKRSPLNRHSEHGAESSLSAFSPLKLLKKKKKEEQKRKKLKLANLIKTVLPALVRDPDTGELRSPESTFKMIDADGSGKVDKSEFALGLELCGLDLVEEDLNLLWDHLDEDGGGDLDVLEMCSKLEELHKQIAEHEKKSANVMPRLLATKVQPLLYEKTYRNRIDVMKDFQDTAEQQEERWLIKFGKDVLQDLHGVCPIIALAAQEFHEKQEKLMESSTKIPPVPLNFIPDNPEYCGHESILMHAGNDKDEPIWKDPDVLITKNELVDYSKGLSNWPTVLIGDSGSGRTSVLAQACKDLRKQQPFDHILFHSIGGTPDSSELTLFLYRMISEISTRFDVKYQLPNLNSETLIESFAKVLLKADIDSMLILVIDNLDRLVAKGEPYVDLEWFPATLPSRCRFIISCCEGKLLNNIRRNRLQFGGNVELHEIKMPRIQVGLKTPKTQKVEEEVALSRASSASSQASSHATSNSSVNGIDTGELGTLRALARSHLFARTGLAISPQTKLMEMIELLISSAEEMYGKYLVMRYCLFVIISRDGISLQDLYDLLNAAEQKRVVMGNCRISWQEFCCLKLHLSPLFLTLKYGEFDLVVPRNIAVMTCLSNHFIIDKTLVEAHHMCAMHYRGHLKFLYGGTWSGECRRALTELAHHFIHSGSWHDLLEIMGNLIYIEARTSLGIHQTLMLCTDYQYVITKSEGPLHWIKTEYLRIRDNYTMVYRYADKLYKHPRWVFSIGANLPDSTGVSRQAKIQWTHKREARPQLVWINKAKVKDPCVICLQDPKIVWHFACFSRDMRFLVTCGQENRIFVWHPINGHIMYTLEGHVDHVNYFQFSWDDQYLISCSRDGSLILWKMGDLESRDRKAEEEEERERMSQNSARSAPLSIYSRKSGSSARPKTGISFKCDKDSLSRASSSASVKVKDIPRSEGKNESILKKSAADAAKDGKEGAETDKDDDKDSEDDAFSRAPSVRSTTSSVKRNVVGIHKWYPIKPIVATIPAHRGTVWSCAFSRTFKHGPERKTIAELHVPLKVDIGHNEIRIDHLLFPAYFLNFKPNLPYTVDRYPYKMPGIIKETRLLTESEKNDQRVKRKEEMMRRKPKEGEISRTSSTGSDKNKIVIDDFTDQDKLAGKLVIIHIPRSAPTDIPKTVDELRALKRTESVLLKRAESAKENIQRAPSSSSNERFERAPSLKRTPSFTRAFSSSGIDIGNVTPIIQGLNALGVQGIIIAMDEVDRHKEITGELAEINCPIMCAGPETIAALKDGQEIVVKRKLHRGNYVASAGADHSIKIWDVGPAIDGKTQQIRRPVSSLEKHKSYVSHVEFSNFGDKLVSSGGDFKVVIWSLEDFSILGIYDEAMAPVTCSVWSPDDTMILSTCHDGYFRLFNAEDRVTIKASTGPHSGHLWCTAFSEDQENFVTVGHEGQVVLWDLEKLIELNKEKTVLEGHHGPILSCSFSSDAQKAVTVSADRTVRVWLCNVDLYDYSLTHAYECLKERQAEQHRKLELKDILMRSAKGWSNAGAAKQVFQKIAHPLGIHVVVFSPSGEHLVTGSDDNQIIFWSLKREQATRTLNGHEAPIATIKFTRNGEHLISGCEAGVIIMWDLWNGRQLHKFTEHKESIRSLDLNRNSSRMISSADDMTVKLWCLDDPYAGLERTKGLTIYSDSEDEKEATSKKAPNDEQEFQALTLEEQLSRARSQKEGAVLFKAYDESQSKVMQSIKFDRVVYSVAYSPDSKSVVMGSADSLIRVYGYADQNENALVERLTIPKEGMESKDKHRSFVKSVLFDKDSRRVLSSGVDGTIKLWSARNGMLLRNFTGHTQEVCQVCISPDNNTVLSCSLDETCRMWNLETGEELFRIKQSHCTFAVAFNADGKFIATAAHDGEFIVWEKDKVDYEKKPLRGWARVRECLRRIRRLRTSPVGLSQDGRRVALIKKVQMLDGKPENINEVKKETQWITVENMVTGVSDYSFELPEPAEFCTINETGEMIIFGRGTRLQAFLNGEQTYRTTKAHLASIVDMRLSESGELLATGSDDTNCRIWRPTAEGILVRVKTLKGHLSSVRCVCFSPDGRYLATGSSDLCVKLWNTTTWKIAITFKAHTNYINAVAFDVSGEKLCTAGEDLSIRVWTLAKEITTRTPPIESVRIRQIPSTVLTCDFTECGRRLVGVTQGRHVYVWHALQGTVLCHWEFLSFDPDAYQNSVWRHALLSLNSTLNSVLVTDATGNTFKFVLMAITKKD